MVTGRNWLLRNPDVKGFDLRQRAAGGCEVPAAVRIDRDGDLRARGLSNSSQARQISFEVNSHLHLQAPRSPTEERLGQSHRLCGIERPDHELDGDPITDLSPQELIEG